MKSVPFVMCEVVGTMLFKFLTLAIMKYVCVSRFNVLMYLFI